MNRTRTTRHGKSLCTLIRRRLGLKQEELALYLGVQTTRVADEESGHRSLVGAAQNRLTFLLLLVTTVAATDAPIAGEPSPGVPLPTPPPGLPLSAEARADLSWHHRVAFTKAATMRLALTNRLQLATERTWTNENRRAVLAAFEHLPPAVASLRATVPDTDPEATDWLRRRLASLLAHDERSGGPLDPATLAYDALRLHLLEAEAATLRAWLDAG